MTYSAPRKLLFAGAGDGLHVFHVAANGGLTEVAGSPFGGFSTLGVTTVQKNGSTFVYAADWADDQVRGYRVNANGSLTELTTSPYPSFDEPVGGAAVKDLVFFANEDNNTVSAFRAQGNGTLVSAPGSPYSVPASFIFNLQLDPQGKTLYVGDNNDTKVFAFKVKPQDASLTALKGSPFTTLADAGEGTVPGKTRMVVVGDDGPTEDLQVLRRLGNGGLEALGEVQDSGFAIDGGGALDPKGKLLVVASNNGQVRSFRLNAQTGALTVADTETGAGFSVNAITVIQR
jgi:6-phosphogluconolactonase (cycloisomerase 2 family)